MSRPFRSRVEGMNRRQGSRLDHNGKSVYFPSRIELKRAAELIMLEKAGKIERLKFHPRYPLEVNGQLITTYVADSIYRSKDRAAWVIEDVKPEGRLDRLADVKIKLFNALRSVNPGGPVVPTITIIKY